MIIIKYDRIRDINITRVTISINIIQLISTYLTFIDLHNLYQTCKHFDYISNYRRGVVYKYRQRELYHINIADLKHGLYICGVHLYNNGLLHGRHVLFNRSMSLMNKEVICYMDWVYIKTNHDFQELILKHTPYYTADEMTIGVSFIKYYHQGILLFRARDEDKYISEKKTVNRYYMDITRSLRESKCHLSNNNLDNQIIIKEKLIVISIY